MELHADAKLFTIAKSDANAKWHTNMEPPEFLESQTTSESLPTSLKSDPKCSRKSLHPILPIQHNNPKLNRLLLFRIVDVTGFKEAIAMQGQNRTP